MISARFIAPTLRKVHAIVSNGKSNSHLLQIIIFHTSKPASSRRLRSTSPSPSRPEISTFAAIKHSLARNRATLRYVRELRPARPIVRLLNGHDTSGFWRESILKVGRDDTVHDVCVDVTGALVTLLDRIDEGVEELLLVLVGEIGVGVDLGFKF